VQPEVSLSGSLVEHAGLIFRAAQNKDRTGRKPNDSFRGAAEDMLQPALTPSRQHDQVGVDFARQLADFLKRPAGENVTIIRPKLEIVPVLHFSQSILHEGDRVGTVQHQVSGFRDDREFVGGLHVNEMNGGSEFLGETNRVSQRLPRNARKIERHEEGLERQRLAGRRLRSTGRT
jgi:hypothetical protein